MPVARKIWGGFESQSAEGGSGGMPPRKIFENLMQNSAFWGNLEKKIEFNSAYWFRTPSLIVLVGFQGGGGGSSEPIEHPGYGYGSGLKDSDISSRVAEYTMDTIVWNDDVVSDIP